MYIEKKKIKGKIYYYLKMSQRMKDKIKTKTVAYLGREPLTKKQLDKKISQVPKAKIKKATEELESSFKDINQEFLSAKQLKKLNEIKKEFNKKLKSLDAKLKEDMFKDFKTYYVYNTNAIEGNTLTLEETNFLLNENMSPQGKDLKEIYDHINEKDTFNFVLKTKPELTLKVIINLHQKLLKNIDQRTGDFRKHNVRVFGADFETSPAEYVRTDMNILMQWYQKNKKKLHPLILAAIFHEKFERIHPFYDGNGRTGRMLINLILLKNNFSPLIVKNQARREYYRVLSVGHQADLTKTQPKYYQEIVLFCERRLIDTYKEIFSKWG